MASADSLPSRDVQVVQGLESQERAPDVEKGLSDPSSGNSDGGSDGPPRDPNLVQWDGPGDPQNPRNWPRSRKWITIVCVSCFTIISPIASSIVAPALPVISHDLHMTRSVEGALVLSIFVAAYALGPLFWGPMSELYGRVVNVQVSNLWFLIFNLACGLAKTKGEMFAFRFLAGIGGSAPLAIGAGVLADLFAPEERGAAMGIYYLAPMLGPALGPLAGGFIVEGTSWRWVFYATTIACGVVQAAGVLLLRETYAPVVLGWKKKRLIKETGNAALRTPFDRADKTPRKIVAIALSRPFRILATQPIAQIISVYMMVLYGIMYLVLSTFASVWTAEYHESSGIAGLNYISLSLGLFIGALIIGRTQDKIYAALKRRYVPDGGPGRPEFRVPMLVPSAILLPAGLLMYSWTAEKHAHWILPNIGGFLFSLAITVGMQSLQAYAVDAFSTYAASAVGVMTFLRSLAGFGFPLFAPDMYAALGYGRGGTVLAGVAIAIAWPSPILLWYYGPRLRAFGPSTY